MWQDLRKLMITRNEFSRYFDNISSLIYFVWFFWIKMTVGLYSVLKFGWQVNSYLSAVIVIKLVSSVWNWMVQVQMPALTLFPVKYCDVLFRLTPLMSSQAIFVPTLKVIGYNMTRYVTLPRDRHCARSVAPVTEIAPFLFTIRGELKQQRRRRLRKRHVKSEVALLQTLSRLFHVV